MLISTSPRVELCLPMIIRFCFIKKSKSLLDILAKGDFRLWGPPPLASGLDIGLEFEVVIVLVGEGILFESFKLNKAQASLSCGLLTAIRLLFELFVFEAATTDWAEAAEVAAIFDVILAHCLTAAAAGHFWKMVLKKNNKYFP